VIQAIAFAISSLGALLLVILIQRIRAAGAEATLRKHRAKDAGFADLLNYAAVVDDGIIVNKNGSFMAAWIYKGADNASSTEHERETVSARMNQALKDLGNGWVLHVDAVRRPAPAYPDRGLSNFPDVVTAALDEERRRLFERLGIMHEGYFVCTVTWFPPVLAQRKFVELMFEDDAPTPNKTARTTGLVDHFKREVTTLESRLSLAVQLTRLCGRKLTTEDGRAVTHDDLLAWLQFCVTGRHHPVQLPSNPMYLDTLIGGQEMWAGVVPRIGRNYIQVVSIDGFPLECTPGILSALAELPCEYRWSSRFICMDQHEAIAALDKYRKKWRQKVRGFFDQVFNTNSGAVNLDAQSMVNDAEAASAEISSGLVSAGYYTSVVVLMDEDRQALEAAARRVEKAINSLGFAARIETINTVDAFLGSLPGHGVENVRRPLLNSMNLADLLPTSSIWTGSATAPCPTYPPGSPALMHCVTNGATPFRLNLHVRDLGHSIIFGPTRAGKSTFLALLAAQLRRYRGMSIYAFDKGNSLYALAAAIRASTQGRSGLHFTVAGDEERLVFCPLQFLSTKSDRAWAMEWIDNTLALNGLRTTPEQRNEIAKAVMSMHASGARTLSEFTLTVQDIKIREALKQYTVDGAMGNLLDADSDGLALSDFTVFEVEQLMNLGEKFVLPVLSYLFRRIERSLLGQPAVIIVDEAWLMLAHPAWRDKLKEWLKAWAKANCAVILATQNLSDAEQSGILDVIVEATATKVFLPNIYARDKDASALYKRMGLNDRQIDILATAVPKRHYYYVSEAGRRLFELALGPLAMAFVGASDKDSVQAIRRLESQHGHDWIYEWLADRGIRLSDYAQVANVEAYAGVA
jgi:type IV secretion system protein TrbE